MQHQLQENIINPISLDKIENQIGYTFNQKTLLEQALTHASLKPDLTKNYQRLEFLGDSILNYVVTESLYGEFETFSEGDLTEKRAKIVNYKTLYNWSQL